jgi:hypothetical protein
VEPEVKRRSFQLNKKYLSSPARKELHHARFSVMDRRKENNVSIFREENVELEKEDTVIGQMYQDTHSSRSSYKTSSRSSSTIHWTMKDWFSRDRCMVGLGV